MFQENEDREAKNLTCTWEPFVSAAVVIALEPIAMPVPSASSVHLESRA